MSGLVDASGAPLSPPAVLPASGRTCVACNCTEAHACVADGDEPCRWEVLIGEEAGLCSSCIQIASRVNGVVEQLEAAGIIGGDAYPCNCATCRADRARPEEDDAAQARRGGRATAGFPVLWPIERHIERELSALDCPREVPWALVRCREMQAQRNHGQSLERLAERGGLDPTELCAVLDARPWSVMTWPDAAARLREHLNAWDSIARPR